MAELSEASPPMELAAAVEPDVQMLSREQLLLERMRQQIKQGGQG